MSQNKKPEDNLPDLDEVWRELNQKLGQLFGGNGGKSGQSNNKGNSANPFKKMFLIMAALVVVWLAYSCFYTVKEGQTAVVMTFGRFSYTANPGFNMRLPAPIQTHEIVNLSQLRTVEVGYSGSANNKNLNESLMLTEDENIIDIQFAVQYRLKNASDWIFNNRNQEQLVKQVAETAVREVVGKLQMDSVLYEDREQVANNISTLMQDILDRYRSGVQVVNITMQAVQPPEQVQTAFDDAVRAGQDRERQKNEGQAYANDVIPRAQGAAARLLQEAEGYRELIVANAQGNAARFNQVVTEYQKAPVVTRDRMYLETMQQIFSNTNKIMVDTRSNSMLYLPLDRFISQTNPANNTNAGNVTNPPSNTHPNGTANTLPTDDRLRNLDQRLREAR